MEKLAIIGINGAGWEDLACLLDVDESTLQTLKCARQVVRPLLFKPALPWPSGWVTIATGANPGDHGVFWREERWARGVRPVSQASWRVQPVWTALERLNVRTLGIGWPASRHGSDWPGVHVDESFFESAGFGDRTRLLPLRCAPRDIRRSIRTVWDSSECFDSSRGEKFDMVDSLAGGSSAPLPAVGSYMNLQSRLITALTRNREWECLFSYVDLGVFARSIGLSAASLTSRGVTFNALHRLLDDIRRVTTENCSILYVSPGTKRSTGFIADANLRILPSAFAETTKIQDIARGVMDYFFNDPSSQICGQDGRYLAAAGDYSSSVAALHGGGYAGVAGSPSQRPIEGGATAGWPVNTARIVAAEIVNEQPGLAINILSASIKDPRADLQATAIGMNAYIKIGRADVARDIYRQLSVEDRRSSLLSVVEYLLLLCLNPSMPLPKERAAWSTDGTVDVCLYLLDLGRSTDALLLYSFNVDPDCQTLRFLRGRGNAFKACGFFDAAIYSESLIAERYPRVF